MKQLASLALLGLVIIGCSKNAPITLKHPPTVSGLYDYRYGNFGQTRAVIEANETSLGNHGSYHLTEPYQIKTLTYVNQDMSRDDYSFNSYDVLTEGDWTSTFYYDKTQLNTRFQAIVDSYNKAYGVGVKRGDFTYYTGKTQFIQLGEYDTVDAYYFMAIFVPVSELHKN